MATATGRKLRPPLKWHGGKAYLARRIAALFPPHRVYLEPFLGGGSVLLNKTPAPTEVVGDIDGRLMLFWRVLASADQFHRLHDFLATVAYTADEFRRAQAAVDHAPADPWEQPESHWHEFAAFYLIRNRLSRGGLGRDFAWSERLRGKRRPGGPVPGDVNAWDTIRADLPLIHRRLSSRPLPVRIVPGDAVDLIRRADAPDAVIYCDPPYLHETRTARSAYAHEMSRAGHERLLDCLLRCHGHVFLSGYRSGLYDSALAGWTRHEFEMPNHSGQGKTKQRRVECVWTNG